MLVAEQMRQQGDTAGLPVRVRRAGHHLEQPLRDLRPPSRSARWRPRSPPVGARSDLSYTGARLSRGGRRGPRAILDEADAYCREGRLLRPWPRRPRPGRLPTWFLDEFVAQAAGRPPTAWADRVRRRAASPDARAGWSGDHGGLHQERREVAACRPSPTATTSAWHTVRVRPDRTTGRRPGTVTTAAPAGRP